MARKKKTPKELCMNKEEFYKIRMLLAEGELAQLKMSLEMARKKEYIKEIDPEGRLGGFDNTIKALSLETSTKRTGYNETLKNVGERLEITIDKYTWDEETGLLQEATED